MKSHTVKKASRAAVLEACMERLMQHFKAQIPPGLEYNWATDALSSAPHSALSHLEKANTFVDFSSEINSEHPLSVAQRLPDKQTPTLIHSPPSPQSWCSSRLCPQPSRVHAVHTRLHRYPSFFRRWEQTPFTSTEEFPPWDSSECPNVWMGSVAPQLHGRGEVGRWLDLPELSL